MTRSPSGRRFATVLGVIAALLLGFGSIQAAADWTAAAAPLTVTPDSISNLKARLADEQQRAADLQQQLDALDSQSTDLAAALEAARTRIGADSRRAAELAAQLRAAKRRLANLQVTIAATDHASKVQPAGTTVVRPAAPSSASSGGEGRGADWGGGDD